MKKAPRRFRRGPSFSPIERSIVQIFAGRFVAAVTGDDRHGQRIVAAIVFDRATQFRLMLFGGAVRCDQRCLPAALLRPERRVTAVSTRVVSWKDAAEMKLRVCKLALVMPSSTGLPSAGTSCLDPLTSLALIIVHFLAVDLFARPARWCRRSSVISTFCSIWRTIVSMCLSLIFTPCKTVDFLDFRLTRIFRQRLNAEHFQDVVRIRRPADQIVAALDEIAFLHVDHLGLGASDIRPDRRHPPGSMAILRLAL